MFNRLLNEQFQKFLGKFKQVPAEWQAFLEAVSHTYNRYQKDTELLVGKTAAEIQELNIKVKIEADELQKAHSEFGRILNSVNYGFFSRNMITNRYTYLSNGCERIYGLSVHEFFENNQLWFDVIYPEDRTIVEKDNERLNNNQEVFSQYRIVRKDGSTRWIEITIIPFFKDEKLSRVDGVISDITERKSAETEREMLLKEMSKSNADLKQFSYITSHNLRSPLSNIQSIAKLFNFSESEVHNRHLGEMLAVSAGQLQKTIDDISQILVIKNKSDRELSALDLNVSFAQVIEIFVNALDEIGAAILTDFRHPYVQFNKIYLESIFINLISNAIKYRSSERKLVIKVESCFDENGSGVQVRFSDNGTGIDLQKHKDKVFGLYQRFHEGIEGDGLGLFMIKSQVEASGGKIFIESEPGSGATFILTLAKGV